MKRAVCLLVSLGLSAMGSAVAAACPRHTAPGSFNNPAQPWQKTDTGIVVDGFVDFKHPTLGMYQVRHGVDLSEHNIVDYRQLRDCGAEFAFVRLDPRYRENVTNLQQMNIPVYPYVFFPIPKALRQRASNRPETPAEADAKFAQYASLGENAARDLLGRAAVDKSLGAFLEAVDTPANPPMIALDIEEKLIDEPNSSPSERVAYGRYYARAVCSWLNVFTKKYPKTVAVLYTTPSLYFDYLDKALPEDHQCLQGLPIWLARTTIDGGDVIRSSNSVIDKYAQRICLVSGGNRCITHQYSHRGVFSALGRTTDGSPPHIDLNRFFDTKVVENAVGGQHVRSEVMKY